MKFLVVLVALIATVLADKEAIMKQFLGEMNNAKPGCLAESGSSADAFNSMLKNNKIPEDHNGKCMLFCMHKYFKIQNADGSANAEGALKTFEFVKPEPQLYAILEKIVDVCKSVPLSSDPCESAAAMGECALAESKKAGFGAEMFDMEVF